MPDIAEEIRAELQRIATEAGEVNADLRKHVDGSIDKVMTALRRSISTGGGHKADLPLVKSDAEIAFGVWLRKGQEGLGPDQIKAMTVGNDSSGGYLAPSFFSAQIEQYIRELSPIVQRARDLTFSQGEADLPKVTSGTSATWVGELEQRPETGLEVGLTTLRLDELACYVDVSQRLLEDAALNIEDLLAEDLGQAFASALTSAVIAGNGVKKPLGLLYAADVTRVASLSASTITSDGLIDMTTAIPAPLLAAPPSSAPVFLMNRTTAGIVRKLRNAVDGAYMWQPGLQLGQPNTLLGYEVLQDENMPPIAAGSYPIVFGNFRRGMATGSKPNAQAVTILRDPFTLGTTGQVRFHARKRAGAVVYQGRAFAKMQIAAT